MTVQTTSTPVIEPTQEIEVPRADFVVINGKVHLLTETACPLSEMTQELKEFYKAKIQELKEELSGVVIADSIDEFERQLERVRRLSQRNTAIIPPELHNKTVMFYQNEVMECRRIQYCPSVMFVTPSRVKKMTWGRDAARNYVAHPTEFKKVNGFLLSNPSLPSESKIIIKFKQELINYPMNCMFSTKRSKIFLDAPCYHRLNDGNLCTGDGSPEAFWNDGAFNQNINILNTYSLATGSIVNPLTVLTVAWQEFLKDAYVSSVSVRRPGGNAWTV